MQLNGETQRTTAAATVTFQASRESVPATRNTLVQARRVAKTMRVQIGGQKMAIKTLQKNGRKWLKRVSRYWSIQATRAKIDLRKAETQGFRKQVTPASSKK
jgi:hypothetical protein